jgi:hypothetical protein
MTNGSPAGLAAAFAVYGLPPDAQNRVRTPVVGLYLPQPLDRSPPLDVASRHRKRRRGRTRDVLRHPENVLTS